MSSDVASYRLVFHYRRFDISYRTHFQGSNSQRRILRRLLGCSRLGQIFFPEPSVAGNLLPTQGPQHTRKTKTPTTPRQKAEIS